MIKILTIARTFVEFKAMLLKLVSPLKCILMRGTLKKKHSKMEQPDYNMQNIILNGKLTEI